MDISYRWLKALAPGLVATSDEVAERLAMYGAPVDALVPLDAGIRDIVIARVLEARRHPNADRLSLCQVDAGTGEVLSVVCGAPNVRSGGTYPFAPVGASLPGGVTIRKARIRGEESQGMLCSARELGLGREHEGILELHGDFTPGESFVEAVGLDDVRIVIDVTANRPDLLSHLGIARELAPGGVAGVTLPPFPAGANADAVADFRAHARFETRSDAAEVAGVRITIQDPDLCPRYMGALIRGVHVGPSPEWLATRLRAVGLRPINNVVDATNYVLHELGQPLHAFDLDRLAGREIRVRRAAPGESIATLDGERRALEPGMLVIADAEKPVAVAGVMGGENSEVAETTRDVLLECALFDPAATRRTRRALGLSTDASYRFERGVDPDGMETACRRAVELILAVAGGRAEPRVADVYPARLAPQMLLLRPARAAHLLGVPFGAPEVADLLTPLGFEVAAEDGDAVRVRVPGHRRYDVTREVDLIEEVARRHGYDNFPDELRAYRPNTVPEDPVALLEDRLRSFLAGRGFLESRTMGFAAEAEGDVALVNPLSAAEGRLRRALLPALIHRLEHNFAHGQRNVRLFEIGTVFAPGPPAALPVETTRLAAIFTGARHAPHWAGPTEPFDVWDLKGLLEDLALELGLGTGALEPSGAEPLLVPSLSFRMVSPDGDTVGEGGQLAPERVDAPAWAGAIWGFELQLSPVMATPPGRAFHELPGFPAIERDLALLVPERVPAAAVEGTIRAAGGPHLQDVETFDLYRGPGVPDGTRSIAYRLRFRAPDRTLTDREVDQAVGRVLQRLREEHGVERRG
ncbi:MAG TPA: phenylalanine--tRNA ligase subunit beta [Longimicrobiales bacterium]|nr:phenylalanine--tRNA ligase subunit beta [Longimicrobiales bacterium]